MIWPYATVSELCSRITSGGTPRRSRPEYYVAEGIPWVKTQELNDNRLEDAGEHISPQAIQESSAKLLPEGTILVAMYGATAGKLATLGRPMACNQACCALVAKPGAADSRFLFYALLNSREQLKGLANGAAQQNLSARVIKEFRIPNPPFDVQQRTGNVLGALDDKIAVNERIASTADELAGAVFREHFAQALGFVSDGTSPPPEWTISTIGACTTTVETGTRPKGGVAQYTSGVPSIGAESIMGLGRFDFGKTKFIPEEFFAGMRRGVVQDRDILVYKDGGKPGDFKPHVTLFGNGFPFSRMCINEHVYRVRVTPDLGQEFGFYWLSSEPLMAEMRRRGTGAAIPGMNSTAFKNLPLVIPAPEAVASFTRAAAPLVDRALTAALESRTLAALRDTLLPQLMSGRLRVKDAEKIVEDHA